MMLTFQANLLTDRQKPGTLLVMAEHQPILRCRCLGNADTAATPDDPDDNPLQPFGDHPAGDYRIVQVRIYPVPHEKYGRAFLLLDPIAGDALAAKRNGRTGLALHGGPLNVDGSLRATLGCNRLDDDYALAIALLAQHALPSGPVPYRCLVG